MNIINLKAEDCPHYLDALINILRDSVDTGASIGFMPPLSTEEASIYWEKRFNAVANKEAVLLIALLEDGEVAGTAQLGLETRANGNHRAEVQKVIVHNKHRRKGIAKALMHALEDTAHKLNKTLLVLDTRQGDPSEILYSNMAYTRLGAIPEYCRSANGELDPTVIYYKLLKD